MSDRARAQLAPLLARDAGALAKRYFDRRDHLSIERKKGSHDLVSVADRAVEARIRANLAAFFPEDGIVGEEDAKKEPARPDVGSWVIDPIDGTWCFLNGIRTWCVAIAYVRDGVVRAGAIYDPCSEEMFFAERGAGAFLNDAPISGHPGADFGDGATEIGYAAAGKTPWAIERALREVLGSGGVYRRGGSGCLGLAWTACGRMLAYVEPRMNSWDCLAGMLLVEEAGGWTNGFLDRTPIDGAAKVLAGPKAMRDKLEAIGALFEAPPS